MASLTHDLGTPMDRPERPRAVRVGPERMREGVCRLLGDRGTPAAVQEFMDAADRDGLDLTLMWAAERPDGDLGETVLVTIGVGKTASVFVSGSGGEDREQWEDRATTTAERASAILAASKWLAGEGVAEVGPTHLLQTLVEPRDEFLVQAFLDAGFFRLAELGYMRRQLPAKGRGPATPFPAGVTLTALSELERAEGMSRLRAAMERSYIGTLDCPALCGIREPADVLESHTAVGEFDPRLWFIANDGGRPEGCLLLSPCPGQQTVELVYIGLGPGLRGRGVGTALIDFALSRLAGRREATLACAVDLANTPALRLYRAAKFRQFATRTAMIKSLR